MKTESKFTSFFLMNKVIRIEISLETITLLKNQ